MRVGILPPAAMLGLPHPERRKRLGDVAGAGLDHVAVGDHVSFFVGAGFDGLAGAVEAGCAAVNLIPCARDWTAAVEGCAEIRGRVVG